MMHPQIKAALKAAPAGKWPMGYGQDFYIHESALPLLPDFVLDRVAAAASVVEAATGTPVEFNVVKFLQNDTISLLWYPTFDDDPHPYLHSYFNVDVDGARVRNKQLKPTVNPAIIHRKESMVAKDHPMYDEWKAFSDTEEAAGLLSRSDIGFTRQWNAFLQSRGFAIIQGELVSMAKNPRCSAKDYEGMGRTFRLGLGLPPQEPGETLAHWAIRGMDWGFGPLVARYLYHRVQPKGVFLDFGAGAGAMQVRGLRKLGYNVIGYEWPPDPHDTSSRAEFYYEAVNDGMLDPNALSYEYDYVLASNVFNVQPTWPCFHETLELLQSVMKPKGTFICNLASTPRELWSGGLKGDTELELELLKAFSRVKRYVRILPKGTKQKVAGGFEYYPNTEITSSPIWECKL
jgi:hypothetical protein